MKELIKELNVSIDEKYLITLKTLGAVKPFSTLRNSDREMETLVELYKIYNKHHELPPEERNRLVFDYYSIQRIADKMGVSKGRVFNLISSLIDRGFIYRNENGKRMMNPRFVIPEDLEVITFRFKK